MVVAQYSPDPAHAYVTAAAALFVLWIVYRIATGRWNPAALAEGADGRPSLSKFQFFLWTLAALFGFVAVAAARFWGHEYGKIDTFPENLLLATGFSTVTAAAAKGITVSYLANNQIVKRRVKPGTIGLGALVNDDDGFPDLSKVQMLAWTLISLGVFLVRLHGKIAGTTAPDVPDIDAPLMVLMGIGQAGYLGKKLTSTDQPRLTAITPSSGAAGTVGTIFGLGFDEPSPAPAGGAAAGPQPEQTEPPGVVTFDGITLAAEAIQKWESSRISFTLPARHPSGHDWKAPQQVAVGVMVGGVPGSNTLTFTVTS